MLLDEFETKSYRIKQFFSRDDGISGTSFEFEGKENGWQIRLTDYMGYPGVRGTCHFMLPGEGEFKLGFYTIKQRQAPEPHLDLYVSCPAPQLTQHRRQIELFFREFLVRLGEFGDDEWLNLIELT